MNSYGAVVDPRYFVSFSLDRALNEVLDDDDQPRMVSAEEARQGLETLTDPLKEFLALGDPETTRHGQLVGSSERCLFRTEPTATRFVLAQSQPA
jgi:hypothetical protein